MNPRSSRSRWSSRISCYAHTQTPPPLDQNHVIRRAAAKELSLLRDLQKRRVQLRVGLDDRPHDVRRVGLLLDLRVIRRFQRHQRADEAVADEVHAVVAAVACE